MNAAPLSAVAAPDEYTFSWSLGLTASTVRVTRTAVHATTVSLSYASGYTETVANADRPNLISYSSSDGLTLVVTTTGQLQPLQNSIDLATVRVTARFCDDQSVEHTGVYSNLAPSSVFSAKWALGGAAPVLRAVFPVSAET